MLAPQSQGRVVLCHASPPLGPRAMQYPTAGGALHLGAGALTSSIVYPSRFARTAISIWKA